jgi:hypothetical protein
MSKTILLLLSMIISSQLFSEEKAENHPCKNIKAACEAAGFTKGDHKNKKGLAMDCMKPIMEGQSVAGVTIAAGDVEACKAKKAERKSHK